MKKGLIRKIFKDLRSFKTQVLAVVLLLLLGVFLSVSLVVAGSNLKNTEQKMKEQSNIADIYYTLTQDCTEEELYNLSSSAYINDCSIRKSLEGVLESVSNKYVRIITYDISINTPIIFDGKFDLSMNKSIINHGFYRLHDELKINDIIEVNIGNRKRELVVAGTFNTPEYLQGVHPDFFRADYAAVIVSPELFQMLAEKNNVSYELLVKKSEGATDEDVIRLINQVLGDNKIESYSLLSNLYSQESFNDILIGNVFTVYRNILLGFVLSIVFFVIIISLSRLISQQNKSISIMKMIGYSNSQVKFQYFFIGVIIVLFSISIGVIAGIVCSFYIVRFYSNVFDLSEMIYKINIIEILPIALIFVITVCASTYIAVQKSVNIKPLDLIKKRSSKIHYDSCLSKTKLWKILSQPQRNAVRVLAGHKLRLIGCILMTAICSALLLTILTFIDDNSFMEEEDRYFRNYDGSIILDTLASRSDIDDILKDFNFSNYQLNYEEDVEVEFEENKSKISIIITENEMGGNNINSAKWSSNGVILSETAAKALGVHTGDYITVPIQNKDYLLRIQDTFKYYRQCMIVPADTLNILDTLLYNNVLFNMSSDQQKDVVERSVIDEEIFIGVNFQEDFWQQVANSNKLTSYIFYGIIAVVIIINYYTIELTSRFTFKENELDIAVMQMLGVSRKYAGSIMTLSLWLISLSVFFITGFIFSWLLPTVLNFDNMNMFYNSSISIVNLVTTLAIMEIMFLLIYLKNVKRIRNLALIIKE